ncbi:MAG: FAD-binding oxidoreductase [Bdellovibrio sp.]
MNNYPSWGLYPIAENQNYVSIENRFKILPSITSSMLPRGLGRSYGDSCLNDGGTLLGTDQLNHFISFDPEQGLLCCESGVSFDEILKVMVPQGWFLPVTPGTKFITVGGAIANDVHGKNHHCEGTFGHHVHRFELVRSNGERLICSRSSNSELFFATIGGLGLTGFITWAEFSLKKIFSSYVHQEQIKFNSLGEFLNLSIESELKNEFTVSWVDCVNNSSDIRGIFIRGNFTSVKYDDKFKIHKTQSFKQIPFFFHEKVLNSFSVKCFNELYYRKNLTKSKRDIVHYDPFFYPLDSIHHWNKIYGKRGFLQYQFVVPNTQKSHIAVQKIFSILKKSQMGSFLAVLKTFGAIKSEGLLSFPREGITLALDFPNHGEKLYKILEQCDEIIKESEGAVYPAKDARMSKNHFEAFYPRIAEFEQYIDPQFSSSFWRRLR